MQTTSLDLTIDLGAFADTEAAVEAVSPEGREFLASLFGAGATGCRLPKSRGADLATFAARKGLRVG